MKNQDLKKTKFETTVRQETAADIPVIEKVTIAAFSTLAVSNHTEQFIIRALRRANALTLSLVKTGGHTVRLSLCSPLSVVGEMIDEQKNTPLCIMDE